MVPESIVADAEDRGAVREGLFAGDDPFALARRWMEEASASEPNDPNAIALATVDADGLPNVRMVLLKEVEEAGFVFYTNHDSVKGTELAGQGKAAFVLHAKTLGRQIRARGPVERVGDAQSDAYFDSRHPQSRAGAMASKQSRPLDRRETLVEATRAIREAFPKDDMPRPLNWGGWRIVPTEIEFWADGEHRLHDRFRWTREPLGWRIERLWP